MLRTILTGLLLIILQALCAQTRGAFPVISSPNSELPVKQGFVEVSFGSLYYEEVGEGEPLIFIHGHPFTHRIWDAQLSDFAGSYRVIRYDLRGYGSSTSQMEYIQFTHAEDLKQLMHALDIDKAHLVGIATGGSIVADMAAWFPDKILTATIVNGYISKEKGPSEPMDAEESATRDEEIARMAESTPEELKQTYFDELKDKTTILSDSLCQCLWNMVATWDAWQYFHKEARVLGGKDTFAMLQEAKPAIPVLFIESSPDKISESAGKELLSSFPQAEHKTMTGCGYFLNMEQPETFNIYLTKFLQENPIPALTE